ncbi:MAG: hypothetical protein KJO10_03720 [Gammaproteobacteria bacterium]|nr:hypothetical protein [Gammaproteobacteria bacterium]
MAGITISRLQDCLERYQPDIPGLAVIAGQLESFPAHPDAESLEPLADLYEQAYPLLEKALWSGNADFDTLLDCYQSLFREQDALIRQGTHDDRYHFILGIPVADRPQHLRACLESIFQICSLFGYGGKSSGRYERIRVVVAEDSVEEENIRRHIDLVEEYRQKGLQVFHLGQEEQYELLQAIPGHEREKLGNILTTRTRDRFYLKGQAANRNLCYLKFLQLTENRPDTLYYLVDSDQAFCVERQTETGDEPVYALNYFHYISKIFRNTGTLVLTGKLTGDPPVSPSVMAANFLDDVTAFFTRLAETCGSQRCSFHDLQEQRPDDAAYHDMAGLFGFENRHTPFTYRCRLEGEHDHEACLDDFARRLNGFFFGEHLTRKTCFSHTGGFDNLAPARTVYPGNYIVNYAGLKYIIPFGHLRLRMSGPTAGRLIQAEIKERFVSANLPMLHRRTTQGGLADDFRPGVELGQERIDVSDEFERQFFGDLMLFSVADMVTRTDVSRPLRKDELIPVIDRKEAELLVLYRQKHEAILETNRQLNALVFDAGHWWLDSAALADALRQVRAFTGNMEYNFGEQSLAYRQIQSKEHREKRKQQIVEALVNYRAERDAWDRLF